MLNRKHKVSTNQIAVLTPYSAQKHLIGEKIQQAKLNKVTVASITESQGNNSTQHFAKYYSLIWFLLLSLGDEYGIVILSTVRSLPIKEITNPKHVQADRGWLLEHLGFLTDEHQLNVGITRSKYGLVIVGKFD